MSQATFPDGIDTDIPDPLTVAIKQVLDEIFAPTENMAKVQDHAAAGRREDLEH